MVSIESIRMFVRLENSASPYLQACSLTERFELLIQSRLLEIKRFFFFYSYKLMYASCH